MLTHEHRAVPGKLNATQCAGTADPAKKAALVPCIAAGQSIRSARFFSRNSSALIARVVVWTSFPIVFQPIEPPSERTHKGIRATFILANALGCFTVRPQGLVRHCSIALIGIVISVVAFLVRGYAPASPCDLLLGSGFL